MFKLIKPFIWIFVIIVIVYALYMVYRDVSWNLAGPSKAESFQQPKLKICLFYATWCPHCEKYLDSNVFMATYDELKKQNKYENVTFAQIDYEKNKGMAEKYNISGFPSIVAVTADGALLTHFNGDRSSKKDLIEFVNEAMSKF